MVADKNYTVRPDTIYLTKDGTLAGDIITSESNDVVDIDCVDFTETFDRKITSFALPKFGKNAGAPETKFVDLNMQDWLLTIKGKFNGNDVSSRFVKYQRLRNLLIGGSSNRTIKIVWKDMDSDSLGKWLTNMPYEGTIRRQDIRKSENLQWYDVTLVFLVGSSLFE